MKQNVWREAIHTKSLRQYLFQKHKKLQNYKISINFFPNFLYLNMFDIQVFHRFQDNHKNVSTTLVPKTTLETKEVFNLNFLFLQVYKCHQSESWRKT